MDETCYEPQHLSSGTCGKMWTLLILLLLLLLCATNTESCSSRLRNRKRPPTPPPPPVTTLRPSISYDIYKCPPLYEQWYCLNEAECFAIKVGDHLEYNCNCTEGFMGRRCEHKYVDVDLALLSQQQSMLETASLAGSIVYIVLMAIALGIIYYVRKKRQQRKLNEQNTDQVDGISSERPLPFGPRTADIPLERLIKKTPTVPTENGNEKESV